MAESESPRHPDLAATEPDYTAIAKQAAGVDEIRARLKQAQSDASRTIARAIFLSGVFGYLFPEHGGAIGDMLLPHLDSADRRVRLAVGAAAIEMGRNSTGIQFRDD